MLPPSPARTTRPSRPDPRQLRRHDEPRLALVPRPECLDRVRPDRPASRVSASPQRERYRHLGRDGHDPRDIFPGSHITASNGLSPAATQSFTLTVQTPISPAGPLGRRPDGEGLLDRPSRWRSVHLRERSLLRITPWTGYSRRRHRRGRRHARWRWLTAGWFGWWSLQPGRRHLLRLDGRQASQQAGGRPLADTPDGRGYSLVAADGGSFRFRRRPILGLHGGTPLNWPVRVAMTADPVGGYWLVGPRTGASSASAEPRSSAPWGASPSTNPSSAQRALRAVPAIGSWPPTEASSPSGRSASPGRLGILARFERHRPLHHQRGQRLHLGRGGRHRQEFLSLHQRRALGWWMPGAGSNGRWSGSCEVFPIPALPGRPQVARPTVPHPRCHFPGSPRVFVKLCLRIVDTGSSSSLSSSPKQRGGHAAAFAA